MFRLDHHMPRLKSAGHRLGGTTEMPAGARQTLHIHTPTDALRARVESYIHDRYLVRFGARVTEWMPTLVTLQADGEILAAAGYRAASETLFLERYLCAPVEHYLAERGSPVARSRIVEAGQFAAIRPGAGRLLVPLLAQHLYQAGFEWSVSTLTTELHHLFSRMGLAHEPLSAAKPELLDEQERSHWGSYYDHTPQVYAGRLSCIVARFQHNEP